MSNTAIQPNISLGVVETGIIPRGLIVMNTVAHPTYQVDVACSAIRINGVLHSSVAKTVDITASGVNGLDTGTEAVSTWYYAYLITKADGTINGLLSLSTTSPTLPSGYTQSRLVGAVRNNASGDLNPFVQYGRDVTYDWASATDGRVLTSGGSTTWADVDLRNHVPMLVSDTVLINGYTSCNGQTTTLYTRPNGFTGSAYLTMAPLFFSAAVNSSSQVAGALRYIERTFDGYIEYAVNTGCSGDIHVLAFTLNTW